jgi:hypothetical protein
VAKVSEERTVVRRPGPQRNNWNDRSSNQRFGNYNSSNNNIGYNNSSYNTSSYNNMSNTNHNFPWHLVPVGQYQCAYCNGNPMSLADLVYHLILWHPYVSLVVRPGQPLRVNCVFCQLVMSTLPELGEHLVARHLGMIRSNNNYF